MFSFARALSPPSALVYAAWRLRGRAAPVCLTSRSGIRFELRPPGSGNGDYGIAYEILVHRFYDMGDIGPVRLVVDLGTNVGLSVLHWLGTFPECRVIAFEPHPTHAAQAERNLSLNGWLGRVEMYRAAAGARTREMLLTDAGSSSTLVAQATGAQNGAVGHLAVSVHDVFPLLEGRRIDLLKIDIEGGEYEILEDPRFGRLDVTAIVMEWHSRGGGDADRQWCEARLRGLGFTVTDIFRMPGHGMFRARRR